MNTPVITSLFERLLRDCQSINRILSATDFDSALSEASQQITSQLAVLVEETQQANSTSIDMDSLLERIHDLCDTLIREKAQNPLISDELVSLATQAKSNAVEVKSLRSPDSNKESLSPKPWYHLFHWLLRRIMGKS